MWVNHEPSSLPATLIIVVVQIKEIRKRELQRENLGLQNQKKMSKNQQNHKKITVLFILIQLYT